jgi:hypothetical protein
VNKQRRRQVRRQAEQILPRVYARMKQLPGGLRPELMRAIRNSEINFFAGNVKCFVHLQIVVYAPCRNPQHARLRDDMDIPRMVRFIIENDLDACWVDCFGSTTDDHIFAFTGNLVADEELSPSNPIWACVTRC